MTTTVGIRELSRNSKLLEQYDYVDVEDKKTHEYKGLFISPKYADEFKKYLDEKISKDIQDQLDEIMQFMGSMEMEDRYRGLEDKKLLEEVARAKVGL
jgi:mRNA-degrading endonuclease RelE of RelBE toxin-antitoxin system